MASTKEDQHQATAKHAPPKHDPAIPPPRPARSRPADPLRHPAEGRAVAPPVAQVVDPMAVSGPLRLLMVILGIASVGALGSAWYRATHQVVDDGLLVLQGNIDVRQVNLAFKVDGRIATLEVDEGDTVKAGETVATLDNRYFEDDLRAVKARRDQRSGHAGKTRARIAAPGNRRGQGASRRTSGDVGNALTRISNASKTLSPRGASARRTSTVTEVPCKKPKHG